MSAYPVWNNRIRFRGQETIAVPAGSFLCYLIEWIADEAFQTEGITSIDHVSAEGLIKRSVVITDLAIDDTLSSITDTIPYHETLELVGYENIDPDTLKPWKELH